MPKFCPNCGEEISDKVKFCPKCGADIDSFSVKKDKGPYPKWFYGVIIVAIIVVLLAVISMFFVFSTSMNQNIKSSSIITSTPTIVTPTQMIVTTTPTSAPPTRVTQIQWTSSMVPIQMIGQVYGIATTPAAGIDQIAFVIGLAPGAPAMDLTKMKIGFDTSTTTPVILTQNTFASTSYFTTKIGTSSVTSMDANDQVEIYFRVAPVAPNTRIDIGLFPSVGSALTFSKTAPATISATNVLY